MAMFVHMTLTNVNL